MSQTKNILMGCGGVLGLCFVFLVGAVAYFGSGPNGGVLLSNQMEDYALSYIDEHKLLDENEQLIAYYDVTLALDGTEAAVLTDKRVIYHKSPRTESIALASIEHIAHRTEDLTGDIIEIHSSDGKSMKIEIAPLNDGATFNNALRRAWQSARPQKPE